MDTADARMLDRLFGMVYDSTRDRPPIEIVAAYRNLVEEALLGGAFRDARGVRMLRGHRRPLPEEVLSITYEAHGGRERRVEVIDVWVTCPTLSSRRYCLRVDYRRSLFVPPGLDSPSYAFDSLDPRD